MILLLGATGYVGQAFATALRSRSACFIPLSRAALDYSRFELLFDYLRHIKPQFLINAAGYGDRAGGDSCEVHRLEMLQANVMLPQTVARACAMTNTPWAHVSSGSIYCGAKIEHNGSVRIERNLGLPSVQQLYLIQPQSFLGFKEDDEPNFSFKAGPCSFHSGTKALAEEAIRDHGNHYIWRIRLPFNEQDVPGNFLRKLCVGGEVNDGINSLSHLDDCVNACLELWERRVPFGIYNVTNPGAISIREVVAMFRRFLKFAPHFRYCWEQNSEPAEEESFLTTSCILDTRKLLHTGIRLRNVREAMQNSVRNWDRLPHSHPGGPSALLPAGG